MRADLLRLEAFGAVFYQKRTGRTFLYPEPLARLLVAGRERSIVDAYVRGPVHPALTDLAFAQELVEWRSLGIVDGDDRVRARLIDGRGLTRGYTLSAPLVTHVQLTQACNLRCDHCYVPVTPHAGPDELGTREVIRLLEELGAIGCPVAVLAGGEPMRRPDLEEILDALEPADVDATLCTNATLVTEENAARMARTALRAVNVSFDGPDAATHDEQRGAGQFERAMRGARLLIEAGIPEVKLRVTVTSRNLDRMLELAPLATELGATSVVFKPFDQVGVASAAGHLGVDKARYEAEVARVEAEWPKDGCPAIFSDGMPTRPPAFAPLIPTFGCVGGTTSATVLPDGRVVACGVFSDPADWTLHDRGFAESWRGADTIERWRRLEGNEQCRTCEHLEHCGGGCRARAVGAGRGFLEPDPFARCSLYSPVAGAEPAKAALKRLPMATA